MNEGKVCNHFEKFAKFAKFANSVQAAFKSVAMKFNKFFSYLFANVFAKFTIYK